MQLWWEWKLQSAVGVISPWSSDECCSNSQLTWVCLFVFGLLWRDKWAIKLFSFCFKVIGIIAGESKQYRRLKHPHFVVASCRYVDGWMGRERGNILGQLSRRRHLGLKLSRSEQSNPSNFLLGPHHPLDTCSLNIIRALSKKWPPSLPLRCPR